MLPQTQLSKSELFDIANQPTNGSPLKKKKKTRKKRAGKLPRANGNRLNGQKSLGDPGIWHLHLANENLTRFAGKLLLQYARSRLSPWTAFFKVTRAIHPLQFVVSVPPSLFALPFRPRVHATLLSSHFWHRIHFRWNNRPEAFSISITASRTPPAISVANQQRHSRVIGFYVMLSSRELRASVDLFSVRVSPRYFDQSLDLKLIKYRILLDRAASLLSLLFFFFFFLPTPVWFC